MSSIPPSSDHAAKARARDNKEKENPEPGEPIRLRLRGEPHGAYLSRAFRELAAHALNSLGEANPSVTALHDARKAIKEMRSILRLLAYGELKDECSALNEALGASGRLISEDRDRDVLTALFESWAGRDDFGTAEDRQILLRFARELINDDESEHNGWEERQSETMGKIKSAASAMVALPIDGLRGKAVRRRIERSFTKAARSFHRASRKPSTKRIHLWRKRLKDLFYQARLFSSLSREMGINFTQVKGVEVELGTARDCDLAAGWLTERGHEALGKRIEEERTTHLALAEKQMRRLLRKAS